MFPEAFRGRCIPWPGFCAFDRGKGTDFEAVMPAKLTKIKGTPLLAVSSLYIIKGSLLVASTSLLNLDCLYWPLLIDLAGDHPISGALLGISTAGSDPNSRFSKRASSSSMALEYTSSDRLVVSPFLGGSETDAETWTSGESSGTFVAENSAT